MTIEVVHRDVFDGSFINIGCPTVYSNPYIVDVDGDRYSVVKQFRQYLHQQLSQPSFLADAMIRLLNLWAYHGELTLGSLGDSPASHGPVIKSCLEWLRSKTPEFNPGEEVCVLHSGGGWRFGRVVQICPVGYTILRHCDLQTFIVRPQSANIIERSPTQWPDGCGKPMDEWIDEARYIRFDRN